MEFISEREWKEGVGQKELPFLWGIKHMCIGQVLYSGPQLSQCHIVAADDDMCC